MIRSIISTAYQCFLCGSKRNLEVHHIMSNANRDKSTKYGLVVYLCKDCHTGANGVHTDYAKMEALRKIAQTQFMLVYPNYNWLALFHRNYLSEKEIKEIYDRVKSGQTDSVANTR